MIRAIVLPYVRPRPGAGQKGGGSTATVKIMDGEALVNARSVEVGRLVCVEHGAPWSCPTCAALPPVRGVLRARRIVEPGDVAAVVAALSSFIRENGAESVRVEPPHGAGVEGDRARWIVRELLQALGGVPVDVGDAAAVEALSRLPASVVEPARALALALAGERIEEIASAAPPAVAEELRPVEGPRSAGVDPGSHWIAVAVGEGAAAPLRFIASRVFEIGRLVPLRKPRKVPRADGTERTITHRRVIADSDMEATLGAVVDYLEAHGVERVAVERATFFMGGADGARAAGARAAMLLRAQYVGGAIAGACLAAQRVNAEGAHVASVARVESVSSKVWRSHVRKLADHPSHRFVGDPAQCDCGAYPGETGIAPRPCPLTDAPAMPPWRDAVRLAFGGTMPPTPGEHVTDAAGVLVWSVREQTVPRVKRATGEPAPKRSAETRKRAKAAALVAKRGAAGCACAGRYHVPGCPIKAAADAARSAKAAGNRNAVKA